MSEWISWQKLHEPPYSKEVFELLDFIPNGLYPFDSLNKEPLPCPVFRHLYHQQWKSADEDKLTEEEHEDIKRTFAEITDDDLNATSWKYFVLPASRQDVKTIIFILQDTIFRKEYVEKVFPAQIESTGTQAYKARPNQTDPVTARAGAQDRISECVKSAQQIPALAALALWAHEEQPGKNHTVRTLENWIRPVHPQYEAGRPGRKKAK